MILITGAMEPLAIEVIRQLEILDVPFMVLVDNKSVAIERLGRTLNYIEGDLRRLYRLNDVLSKTEKVFLHSRYSMNQMAHEKLAIEALNVAQVRQIVRVSLPAWAHAEEAIQQSNICSQQVEIDKVLKSGGRRAPAYTIVRPHMIIQLLLEGVGSTIAQQGAFELAVSENVPISMIDMQDVAAVIVQALTTDDHRRTDYTLSGPEGITLSQLAGLIADEIGRPVEYQPILPWRRFILDRMRARTLTGEFETIWRKALDAGGESEVNTQIEDILGYPPRSVAEYLHNSDDYFFVGKS